MEFIGLLPAVIGVIANQEDHGTVREFFELFKTPWAFYQHGAQYDVLLCSVGAVDLIDDSSAKLVLVYAGKRVSGDPHGSKESIGQPKNLIVLYKDRRIPIYGNSVTFEGQGTPILKEEKSGATAAYIENGPRLTMARMGYDLFSEIHTLLSSGQPAENADLPAVDLHIDLMRDLIIESGLPLVEVPPVPDGCPFIVCLTHDVDNPAIRHHKWDHTFFGFLYRAVVGSFIDVCMRRKPMRHLLINWAAALRLPLVHLGLSKDFWETFDRYLEMERGLGSTFYVIPFKDLPGEGTDGSAPRIRAASYAVFNIAQRVKTLGEAGCEIGTHGIDAWCNSVRGREERDEIGKVSSLASQGVRMHWLYFGEQSPVALENAGFSYDSTMGYNETIGYRSGTLQVFKPTGVIRLLELPLHVMDTALFFPSYLNLTDVEARKRVSELMEHARRSGGVITINWHDRSIAPERLWDRFYRSLLDELKCRHPWFATGSQAVSWFRKRRSVIFEKSGHDPDVLRAKVSFDADDGLPGLRLRLHNHSASSRSREYVDARFSRSIEIAMPSVNSLAR